MVVVTCRKPLLSQVSSVHMCSLPPRHPPILILLSRGFKLESLKTTAQGWSSPFDSALSSKARSSFRGRLPSTVVVIQAATLKVHSGCSSKPSAGGRGVLAAHTLISSISTITNLSNCLITVMVTSTIKASKRCYGYTEFVLNLIMGQTNTASESERTWICVYP